MGIKLDSVDRYGVIGARLTSLEPTARFTPVGLTEAQWDTLVNPDGAGAIVPGMRLGNAGTSLVISKGAGNLKVTIPKAGISDHGLAYGDAPRVGELLFTSNRGFTGGVADAVYTVEIQSA